MVDANVQVHLLIASVEDGPTAAVILDVQSVPPRIRIAYANRAFFALTGFTIAQIEDHGEALLGQESDRSLIANCVHKILTGVPLACELRLYRADGSAFSAEVRSFPIDARPTRYCVLFVRELDGGHAPSDRFSELLSHALDETSDFVILNDVTQPSPIGGSIAYANRAFLDATGFCADELIGKPSLSIYAADNDPKMMFALRESIGRGVVNSREALVKRKDGSEFWMEVVAKPVVSNQEQRGYRLAVGRDITYRKRAANQVSLVYRVVESLRERIAFYELDDSGNLTLSYSNTAAVTAGRDRLLELLQSEGSDADDLWASITRGGVTQRVITDHDSDGTSHALMFNVTTLRNAGGRIEAVITMERSLAEIAKEPGTPLWLLNFLAMSIPSTLRAASTSARLQSLRALIGGTFGVTLNQGRDRSTPTHGIQIDTRRRVARFRYAGAPMRASWTKRLPATSVTTLRFCIEAAMDRESQGNR